MTTFIPKSKKRNEPWYARPKFPPTVGTKENPLWLLLPEELDLLPPETKLHCIDGTTVIAGINYIDTDTHGGYIAYGILETELTTKEGK